MTKGDLLKQQIGTTLVSPNGTELVLTSCPTEQEEEGIVGFNATTSSGDDNESVYVKFYQSNECVYVKGASKIQMLGRLEKYKVKVAATRLTIP